MDTYFQDIIDLLTIPPGNLVYHLVIVFSVMGAYLSAYMQKSAQSDDEEQRLLRGLGILLVLRISIFIVALLSGTGILGDQLLLLPPLDRTINAVSLIIIIWLWAFPESSNQADISTLLLSLLAIILGIFTFISWIRISAISNFNGTVLDVGWIIFSLVLALLGELLIFIRKPEGWEFGFSMLVILLLGNLGHLFLTADANFPGVVRIAQIAAFPLLYVLPYRLTGGGRSDEYELEEEYPVWDRDPDDHITATKGDVNTPVEEKLIATYFALASESDSSKSCVLLSEAIALSMFADICFMLSAPDHNGQFNFLGGYDRIKEGILDGSPINPELIPRIASAANRNKVLRLRASSKSPDLSSLAEILNLSSPGSLLAAPITTQDSTLLAMVVLLSPYSNRNWTKRDESYLQNLSPNMALILGKGRQGDAPSDESQPTSIDDEQLRKELENMTQQIRDQNSTIEGLETRLASSDSTDQTLVALQDENRRLQEAITEYANETSGASTESVDTSGYETKLAQFQEEIAELQQSLADANNKIAENSATSNQALSSEQAEVIASIAQDVRQPLSSISGYTDLLLGESVGILGALQRKFLDRVKSSTDRMNGLIDDLIQITALDSGNITLTPELVDLSSIIDESIGIASGQIRDKDIVLRVDLPEDLPNLNIDKDALQQILLHLIQNAGAATPTGGEISLRAAVEEDADSDQPQVLVQVTDTGGGISEDDLPRVFSRLYRADNPLIEGVGDTGVGLSIAKTLTEALGGSIWVESEIEVGSTFNVKLPISPPVSSNGGGDE